MATRKPTSDRDQLSISLVDSAALGQEPVWDRTVQYHSTIDKIRAFNWYNYLYNADQAQNFLVQLLNAMPKRKELAKKIKSQKKIKMTSTFGWMCRMIYVGYNPTFTERKRLVVAVRNAVARFEAPVAQELVVEVVSNKPTIQDYLREKTQETIAELEGRFDNFVSDNAVKADAFALMKERNTPQAQVGKIVEAAQKKIDEFTQVQESKDKDLVEGYNNFTRAKIKATIKFFESVIADCASYTSAKKATKKPRIPKAKSADKIVARVKFLKEDTVLKVTSVSPVQVLNAREVWVFNVKTRKIGCYLADSQLGPLSIKGSSITGFDEAASVAKTVRKPAEKLKELLAAGKTQLKKFMSTISAVDVKLTGRLNEDTLIVKVLK